MAFPSGNLLKVNFSKLLKGLGFTKPSPGRRGEKAGWIYLPDRSRPNKRRRPLAPGPARYHSVKNGYPPSGGWRVSVQNGLHAVRA